MRSVSRIECCIALLLFNPRFESNILRTILPRIFQARRHRKINPDETTIARFALIRPLFRSRSLRVSCRRVLAWRRAKNTISGALGHGIKAIASEHKGAGRKIGYGIQSRSEPCATARVAGIAPHLFTISTKWSSRTLRKFDSAWFPIDRNFSRWSLIDTLI